MKKIIVLLFSFIFSTLIIACTSEFPEKLYGYYKNDNEKLDQLARIETLIFMKDEISISSWDFPLKINNKNKNGEYWIIEGKNSYGDQTIKLIIINENEVELIKIKDNKEKSIGKYIKITEEEYKHILKSPKLKEFPSLF